MAKIENPSGIPDEGLLREGLIDRLTQYVNADPSAWNIRYNLGVALAHEGRLDEALEHFRLVLQDSPKHMETLINIGGIHLSRGDAGEALKAFTSALSVWDVPLVRANLAVAYIQLDQLDNAERELRKALAMNPQMPDALTNLGSLLLRQERYEESAQASRQALELSPEFAMAANNLALALLALERVDEAREQAARAKELGYPVHPELLASLGL